MKFPTPGFLIAAFFQVCRRFPGPMISAVIGVFACILLIESDGAKENSAWLVRSWMCGQLGLPVLTALVSFAESKTWKESRIWLLQVIGIATLVGCWKWLDPLSDHFEVQTLPQYLALLLIAHLAVSFAPFLNQRSVREFWEFNRQLFANIVVGAAFTLILFAGLSLALLAVDNLFNAHIPDKTYPKLFVLLAGIFNTTYFLFHFPLAIAPATATATVTAPPDLGSYNWVFRNLCKYILIPIVILYFIILYSYGAKIGLEWSLPKGWVSSLVLGFSVAGIFTYLLNFYLAEEDPSPIVKGFKRWFWWVALPMTLLLFVAIGKRIGDYGVTEERYLVAHLGVWLAASCLYFLFSKNDNIKYIPISLSLFALVWGFGPMSALEVTKRSQKGILTRILERNGRFENGKMKPGTGQLTELEQGQALSAIRFLDARDALNDLLPRPLDSTLLEYNGLVNWLKITEVPLNKTRTLTINSGQWTEPMNIRGYEWGYKLEWRSESENEEAPDGYHFSLSKDGKMLEWRQTKNGVSNLVEMFSLLPAIHLWLGKMEKGQEHTYANLPVEARTISIAGSKGSIRLIANNFRIEVTDQDKQIKNCSGWILLKEK